MRNGSNLIAALLVVGAFGCTSMSPGRRIYENYERIDGAMVFGEIERWEGVARDTRDDALRAGAHLRLALLLSHPDHPEPDYRRALEELEGYRALAPRGGRDPGVRRLQSILLELQRCERRGERRREVAELLWREEQDVRRHLEALQQDSRGADAVMGALVEEGRALRRSNEALTRDNQEMARRILELETAGEKLAKENEGLNETLERLKTLDLQLERMRSVDPPRR